MKLLFAHDVIIAKDPETGTMYNEDYKYALWQRYLEVFSHVTVCSRSRIMGLAEPRSEAKRTSGEGVSFVSVPSLSSPLAQLTKRKEAVETIAAALAEADALLARLPSETGLLAIEAARRMGKPWAVEVIGHAWDALMNYGSWQGKAYAPVMTWRTQRAVRKAPLALYVTEQFLQKHYPCQGTMIACSDVNLPEVQEEVLQRKLAQIDARRAAYRIGLIGYLSASYKGIDTAIRALQLVRQAVPEAELHVLGLGDGTKWQQLAKELQVADKLTIHAPLPSGQAIFEWLDSMDVYIQPSRTEGLPKALLEAMSRGLPALGTAVGGIPELLEDGCLFYKDDHAALAQLLTALHDNKEYRKRLAKQNWAKAQSYEKSRLNQVRRAFLEQIALT